MQARVVLAGFALVACGAAHDDTRAQGMPEIKVPPGANYTVADVAFMQGMIHHHRQALVMAAMAPGHDASASVRLLCEKIDVSQSDEITMMSTWLSDRHQIVPDPNTPPHMAMPGMLSAEQISALDAARGAAFDSLFLADMIQHHEGALKMVAQLFASPGAGQAPEIFRYASDVDADQRGEIGRMRLMLSSIRAAKKSSTP